MRLFPRAKNRIMGGPELTVSYKKGIRSSFIRSVGYKKLRPGMDTRIPHFQ